MIISLTTTQGMVVVGNGYQNNHILGVIPLQDNLSSRIPTYNGIKKLKEKN